MENHFNLLPNGFHLITPNGIHPIALITTLLLSVFTPSYSQEELQLPPEATLEQTLTTFWMKERDAKLAAFDNKPTGDWKHFLPSVGITYTIANQPRPAISWSPLSILNRRDRKQKEKILRKSIILSYEVTISDQIFKLHQLISDYNTDLNSLNLQQTTLDIEEQLFQITQAKYDNNLIKPSQFLQAQRTILEARADLATLHSTILKSKAHILYHSKVESPVH